MHNAHVPHCTPPSKYTYNKIDPDDRLSQLRPHWCDIKICLSVQHTPHNMEYGIIVADVLYITGRRIEKNTRFAKGEFVVTALSQYFIWYWEDWVFRLVGPGIHEPTYIARIYIWDWCLVCISYLWWLVNVIRR